MKRRKRRRRRLEEEEEEEEEEQKFSHQSNSLLSVLALRTHGADCHACVSKNQKLHCVPFLSSFSHATLSYQTYVPAYIPHVQTLSYSSSLPVDALPSGTFKYVLYCLFYHTHHLLLWIVLVHLIILITLVSFFIFTFINLLLFSFLCPFPFPFPFTLFR